MSEMDERLCRSVAFLIDAERLKLEQRKAYVSDGSRRCGI